MSERIVQARQEKAHMSWGHYLFGFSGRLNRAKYWLWILIYFIAAAVMTGVTYAINSPAAGGIVQLVFSIVALISSLAVMTKRLHDRNKSAWWLLIFVLIPSILLGAGIVASVYGALMTDDISNLGTLTLVGGALTLAAGAFLIWAFVELACLRGTIGANQYGPDPLEGRV
jgi:uncharacterized membrane protein YhaH (DUF805 family)